MIPGMPNKVYVQRHATREAIETGETDSTLARRFALEYVRVYGDPIKAYAKVFGVSRQRAFQVIDDYLGSPCVRACLAQVTAPTETIASAGEVLAAVTAEMRNQDSEPKDRLKAAEIMLKVRGHMDRDKKSKRAGSPAAQLVAMVRVYANASPAQLEADLIGGGNAIRDGVGERGEGQDVPGSGEMDEPGVRHLLDAFGEEVAREADRAGDQEAHQEGGSQ